jgi:hypothetical protein
MDHVPCIVRRKKGTHVKLANELRGAFFLLTVHIWSMVLIHFSFERKCILLYYTVLHGPYIAVTNDTRLPYFPSHCTYMVHGPHTFYY